MMRVCIVAVLVLCAGCAWMDPDQAAAVRQVLEEMLARGQITEGQFEALTQLLQPKPDWLGVLGSIGETVLSVVLALLGVKWWRGGITARKGAPPVS